MNNSYQENINDIKETEQAIRYEHFGGFFLILLGGIFMLIQTGNASFLGGSTWLLFLLIPVYWVCVSAYQQYVANGRSLNAAVLIRLAFGLLPFIFVFAVSYLPISWGSVWPIFLIIAGLAAIFNNR